MAEEFYEGPFTFHVEKNSNMLFANIVCVALGLYVWLFCPNVTRRVDIQKICSRAVTCEEMSQSEVEFLLF